MPRKTNMKEKIGALRAFYTAERRVPGYNEMLRIFNYRSKNAVFGLLSRLEESGYITKNKGKIALTDKLTGAIRLLGEVNAGEDVLVVVPGELLGQRQRRADDFRQRF